MIIAITGYIGVGKTSAAEVFREHGWEVVNADELGHGLLNHPEVRAKLLNRFGSEIADRKMSIDRQKLSEIVFNDPEQLKMLNELVHPLLKEKIAELVAGKDKVAVDAALYEELGLDRLADKTILIETDIHIVCERLENKLTLKKIVNIMNSQSIPSRPDFVINNNGVQEQLGQQVLDVINHL